MSALHILRDAPLGALVRFSDGSPRPPERFRRKLRAWCDRNDTGRLVETYDPPDRPDDRSFTLHMATYGRDGTIILVLNRSFAATSQLQFDILERPRAGMVRVITCFRGTVALRHLAPDMAAARAWLDAHYYADARFEVVSDAGAVGGQPA